MSNIAPLSTLRDLTRDEIICRYRDRLAAGKRTKLTASELPQLILHFIDRLQQLQNKQDILALCDAEIALLEEGYTLNSVGSHYLPQYRKAIQEAIDTGKLPLTATNSRMVEWIKRDGSASGTTQEHYGLAFLKYDREVYQELRDQTTANNNLRQDDQKPICVQHFLATIDSLLHSNDSRELTIAIAALTGRRYAEVAARGTFELTSHPYLLRFFGQQKKKQQAQAFDILTLIPAAELLPHIHRYRNLPDIQHLAGLDDKHPKIKLFNMSVNRRVRKLFEFTGLVPVLTGFQTVSIHRFRGIYGAIAYYYFCPPGQGEHRFLQGYLGHVLDDEAKNAPNSNATTHYFHYYLVDFSGNLLPGKGIKLAEAGILPDDPAHDSITIDVPATAVEKATLPPAVLELSPAETTATSEIELSLSATATPETTAAEPPIAPQTAAAESSPPAAKPKAHHKIPADWIKLRDRLLAALPFGTQSPAYKKQRHLFNLLLHSLADEIPHPTADSKHLTPDTQPLTPDTQTPTPEPETVERAAVAADWQDIITQQAKTLAFLSDEVQSLRSLVFQLQQDRDRLDKEAEQLPQLQTQVQQLRADNARLQHDSAKLQAFRQLLDGSPGLVDKSPSGKGSSVSDPAISSLSGLVANSPAPPSPQPKKSRAAASNSDRAVAAETPDAAASHSGSAVARAASIFAKVQEWNQLHPDRTFAVNVSLLERGFGIHRAAAKQFMTENETAIAHHYDSIGVTNPNYHNRGKDLAELKAFVSGSS